MTAKATRSVELDGEWPLVGRSEEIAELRHLLGTAAGVVLVGEAGVGKTRLATECLRLAEASGCFGAHVAATRTAAAIPFGALAGLLPDLRQGAGGTAGGGDTRASMLRRHTAALLGHAGGARLALLVDDAHLLDGASATLIHHLATSSDALLILTVRSSEPACDAVVALWKDRVLERVEVQALPGAEIDRLLATVLGGPVEPRTLAELSGRCRGNALFLRELVSGALESGGIEESVDGWRLTRSLAPPQRLIELVESRLAELEAAERRLLEVISFGEPIGPGELEALGDLAIAEQLERRGLITSRLEGRRLHIRLAHPMFGEVVRGRVSALRHRSIARSLAEATESTGARRREDTLRVATWRLESGGAAPDVMLSGATAARWHHDFPLAQRLVNAAVDAGAGFDAMLLSAQLAGLQGDSDRAELELAALADRAQTDSERALVAINRLDNHVFYLGHIDDGLTMAAEATAGITEASWRDEIEARVAGVRLGLEGPRACAEAAMPLLERASGRALAWACITGAYSLGRLGRNAAALDASARGHEAHLALGLPLDWDPFMHRYFHFQSLAYLGRVEESHALAAAAHVDAVADGNLDAQAYSALFLSQLVTDRGHVRDAIAYGVEATALFRQLGRPGQVEFCLTYLAMAQAVSGDAPAARRTLHDLDHLGLVPSCYVPVDILRARAWTTVAEGDLVAARELLLEAVRRGAAVGDHVGESAALHSLARLGQPEEAVERLSELAGSMEGELIGARTAHARALHERDAASLAEVSRRFERMSLPLLAAEAAADEAVVHRRAKQAKPAAAAEWRAGNLAEACPDAATPALQTTSARAILTRAEREVALLAGSHTNKAIADKLFISVRTVENHLQRVYGKLGISKRSDIDEALGG